MNCEKYTKIEPFGARDTYIPPGSNSMIYGSKPSFSNIPKQPYDFNKPNVDNTDYSFEKSTKLIFTIPKGNKCKNDGVNDLFNQRNDGKNPSIWLNKYQQIQMLHRYVKRCDEIRESKNNYWTSWWYDYNANCWQLALKEKTHSEIEKESKKSSNGVCKSSIKDKYKLNPNCKSYEEGYWWGWKKEYIKKYKDKEWITWAYDWHELLIESPGRKWVGYESWVKKYRNYYLNNKYWHNHNNAEYSAYYLLQNCPILKTLTYPDEEGKKYWKIRIGNNTADYGPLYDKLKKGISNNGEGYYYINPKILRQFESEATIGQYWRASYLFIPELVKANKEDKKYVKSDYKLDNGSDKNPWSQNKEALNKENYINMNKVPDEYARTPENFNMDDDNQIRFSSSINTGYGYCLCDIIDNLLRRDSRNCLEGSSEIPNNSEAKRNTAEEGESVYSPSGKRNINPHEIDNTPCSNLTYQKAYSWCFTGENNDLIREYGKHINSCIKSCLIYKSHEKDGYREPAYSKWQYSVKNNQEKEWALISNIYSKKEQNCLINSKDAKTNNINEIRINECCNELDNKYNPLNDCLINNNNSKFIDCTFNNNSKIKNKYIKENFIGNRGKREGFYNNDLSNFDKRYNGKKIYETIKNNIILKNNKVGKYFFVGNIINYIWINYKNINTKNILLNEFNLEDAYEKCNSNEENIYKLCYEIIKNIKPKSITIGNNSKDYKKYDYYILGSNYRKNLHTKLLLVDNFKNEVSDLDSTSKDSFYKVLNTLPKIIYAYLYVLRWGSGDALTGNNDLDDMLNKIRKRKDSDFSEIDYQNSINYVNNIKDENNMVSYIAQIQNLSTINTTTYYRIILWFIALGGLSVIIYKKLKK